MMTDNALFIEQQDWQRFLTSDGLAEKAGCSPDSFPYMVVKEFADNAADIGGYGYQIREDEKLIAIWNGGDGISTTDVHKYFSIKRPLRSSKHWRRGERGALGNGIRAALAGCRICKIDLRILSQGFSHDITLQDDGEVSITTNPSEGGEVATKILLNFSEDKEFQGFPFSRYLETQMKTQGEKVT